MPYSPGFPLVLENTAENTLMCPSYNVCFMRYSLHTYLTMLVFYVIAVVLVLMCKWIFLVTFLVALSDVDL